MASWDTKFWRAKEHRNALQFASDWFCAGTPGALALKPNPNSGEQILYVEEVRPVDDRVSVLIGDCVQALRQALDHIVWRILEIDLGEEPPYTSEFPIFPDPKRYSKDVERKIGGIRSDVAAFIKSAQPYNRGYEDFNVLHELSRRDKHRTLLLTSSLLTGARVHYRDHIRDYTQNLPPGPLVANTDLAGLKLPDPLPKGWVGVELELPFHIVFEVPGVTNGPILEVMDRLINLTKTTIRGIERAAGPDVLE
jgi:hypothetical protein